MSMKQKILPGLVGAMLISASTLAFGQAAEVSAGMDKYEAASEQLIKLYTMTDSKGRAVKITELDKRIAALENQIWIAAQKLDIKLKTNGLLVEKTIARMQALTQTRMESQLNMGRVRSDKAQSEMMIKLNEEVK
jgi:hypothetical protein